MQPLLTLTYSFYYELSKLIKIGWKQMVLEKPFAYINQQKNYIC